MFAASAILAYFLAALMLTVALTAIFGPWLAFLLKILEIKSKKAFLGLLARQTARTGLWFGALFSVALLAAMFQGFFKLRAAMPPAHMLEGAAAAGIVLPPSPGAMGALAAAFTGYIFLLAVAHFSWVKLRSKPGPQAFILLLAALAGVLGVILAYNIAVLRPQILNPSYYLSLFTWTVAMYPFGHPTPLSSLLMILKFFSGALGIAATMCACCMLLYRTRDDFGRDYYNYALRHLARWNIAATLLTLASGLGMMLLLRGLIGPRFDLGLREIIVPALIYVSCAAFWLALLRSPTPLRHKAGIWMSMAALVIAMIGHLIYVRNFFVAVGMMPGMLPLN